MDSDLATKDVHDTAANTERMRLTLDEACLRAGADGLVWVDEIGVVEIVTAEGP